VQVLRHGAARHRRLKPGETVARTLAELGSLGGRHLALRADVSDDAAVAALAGRAGETIVIDGGYAATS